MDDIGNARWLRNLMAKCFSDLLECQGSCSLGLVNISNDKLSCLAKGNFVLGLYRHEHGRTEVLANLQSSGESAIYLGAAGRLSKGFVKSLFTDVANHAESQMQADDIVLIGTGVVAEHVGSATLQTLVHKACVHKYDQFMLASSIIDVAMNHALLASPQNSARASCIVGFLVEATA